MRALASNIISNIYLLDFQLFLFYGWGVDDERKELYRIATGGMSDKAYILWLVSIGAVVVLTLSLLYSCELSRQGYYQAFDSCVKSGGTWTHSRTDVKDDYAYDCLLKGRPSE